MNLIEKIEDELNQLTDSERENLLRNYCPGCGAIQPKEGRWCQCQNDD